MDNRDLSLVMDFYELTMSQVYFNEGKTEECVTFDLFYRKNPDNAGYSLCAGLEQVVDFVKRFKFNASDIEYLRSTKQFSEDFLNYLKNFKFKGDIYAIPEGTPVFPYEPIIRVKGNIIEAQLLETALLLCINHQTMIATKAHRAELLWNLGLVAHTILMRLFMVLELPILAELLVQLQFMPVRNLVCQL